MTEKSRILHIHVLPVISGSGINTFLTMNGLKHKYCMEIACAPGKGLEEKVRENGMRFWPIQNFVSEVNFLKDLHALWQILRLLRKEKFDLLHTHNSKGGFIGRLAARILGGPPVVHTVHGFAFHENESWLRRVIFFWLEKISRDWCDKFICISQPLVDLWIKTRLSPPEKIRKIYSGIDTQEFSQKISREPMRARLGIAMDEIAIGQVSKLWEGKGHEDILNACPEIFRKVPKCKFFFLGDGPLRSRLEKCISESGLDGRMILLGHHGNVAEISSAFDIAVLASHYEGMGRAVLEAMAMGLPVVACRVGGIIDLVEHEKTGILVDPHKPDQLARAIIRLATNSALCKEMGEAGRRKIGDAFSIQTMIRQIDEVYQEILLGKR